MYLAARVQLAEERIRPALEAGVSVISNRFDLSTIAYQIYGRERLDLLTFVRSMSEFALGGVRPDVVILLDLPPEVGLRRAAQVGSPDRFESEKVAFHERVRSGYHAHITEYPEHHIIDATRAIEDVHAEVRTALAL
jgi:dTMP kinase